MEQEVIDMNKDNIFERHRRIPGEECSVPFMVKRKGQIVTACYYYYDKKSHNSISISQVCFCKKNKDEATRFTPMIEMPKYKSKLKMRRTIIKMIKTKIKNGEV